MGLHTQHLGDRDVEVRSTFSVKMQSELRFLCGGNRKKLEPGPPLQRVG
jgi:hypothetical protein